MAIPFIQSPCGLFYILLLKHTICALCSSILEHPVQFFQTRHRFCLWCIYREEDEISLHPPHCRLCTEQGFPQSDNCLIRSRMQTTRELLLDREIILDHAVGEEIANLPAQCIRCGLVMRYSERQDHAH